MTPGLLSPGHLSMSAELAERQATETNCITFHVHGPAAPKGSMKMIRHRHTKRSTLMPDNPKALRTWTLNAKGSAYDAGVRVAKKPTAIGILLWLVFEPRTSAFLLTDAMVVKPDVDKCLRALLDALTGVAYEDDCQVVDVAVRKRYGAQAESFVQVWEVRSPARPMGSHSQVGSR